MRNKFIQNFKITSTYSLLSISIGSTGLLTLLSVAIPLLFLFDGHSINTWLFGLPIRLELPISEVERVASQNYSVFPIWGELTIFQTNTLNGILYSLIPLLVFGSLTYASYILRKLFKNIYDGNYFAKENKKIMYKLGIMCIIIPHVIKMIQYAMLASLPKDLIVDGMKIIPTVSQGLSGGLFSAYFFFGMLLIILADVFSEGKRLKEENDLTV